MDDNIKKKAKAIIKCHIDCLCACLKIVADDNISGFAKSVLIEITKAQTVVQSRLINQCPAKDLKE